MGNHITKAGGHWIAPDSVTRYWNALKKYASHISWCTPPSPTKYKNIIRTIGTHYKAKLRNRFPLTATHLAAILAIGPSRIAATLAPRQAKLFKQLWPATLAISSIGIFGLARKRELLRLRKEPPSTADRLLQFSDIEIRQMDIPGLATNWHVDRWLQVNLRWSKMEKLNATPLVAGQQQGMFSPICPVYLWREWTRVRHQWATPENTVPFILPNGCPYNRDLYNKMIGACLPFFKIDRTLYSGGGFSLRKGGGQSLANNNLPDALLQRLGRWNSIAVRRYRTFSPIQRVQLSRWFDRPYDKANCVFNASITKWDPSTEQVAFSNVPITPLRSQQPPVRSVTNLLQCPRSSLHSSPAAARHVTQPGRRLQRTTRPISEQPSGSASGSPRNASDPHNPRSTVPHDHSVSSGYEPVPTRTTEPEEFRLLHIENSRIGQTRGLAHSPGLIRAQRSPHRRYPPGTSSTYLSSHRPEHPRSRSSTFTYSINCFNTTHRDLPTPRLRHGSLARPIPPNITKRNSPMVTPSDDRSLTGSDDPSSPRSEYLPLNPAAPSSLPPQCDAGPINRCRRPQSPASHLSNQNSNTPRMRRLGHSSSSLQQGQRNPLHCSFQLPTVANSPHQALSTRSPTHGEARSTPLDTGNRRFQHGSPSPTPQSIANSLLHPPYSAPS